jgi:hypothetical protein
MVPTDPMRARQLSHVAHPGVFLFWAPGRRAGTREGLVLVVHGCEDPRCDRRHVQVEGFLVDDRLLGVSFRKEMTRLHWSRESRGEPKGGPVLLADIDLGRGTVQLSPTAPATERDPQALAWLERELDAEVLAALDRQWLAAKGRGPAAPPAFNWRNWERGTMVAWCSVFPTGPDAVERFVIDGRELEVMDFYCPTPDCTCTEVLLMVVDPTRAPNQAAVGRLVLRLPDGEFQGQEAPAHERALIERVGAELAGRYDLGQRYAHRKAVMQAACAEGLEVRRRRPPLRRQ